MTNDRQPQEERDRYWWKDLRPSSAVYKRHQEYRKELKTWIREYNVKYR